MPKKKLVYFKPWGFYSPILDELQTFDADGLPFITYDDGIPCYEANMYIYMLLRSESANKITTLNTYASIIIHIVRYCHNNYLRFSQLNDAHFTFFVQGLQGERNSNGKLVRGNNTVRDIAHLCLRFLVFVQDLHDLKYFIGTDKANKILVQIKKSTLKLEGDHGDRVVETTTHSSVPTKDPVRRRLPVGTDDAKLVWNWIESQDNEEKVSRDLTLFQCLEELGARISEIHMITVEHIEDSIDSGENPYLLLNTLKRKDDKAIRYIPVTHSFLNSIWDYIKGARIRAIIKTIGKKNDHGFLLISLTTGAPFKADSATTYLRLWKKKAGVKNPFHAHLFRHKFITEKLKEIILQHKDINSADDFRKHMLNTEKFKLQLRQWTGHTHTYSLDTYIHLAFEELNGSSKAYSAMLLNSSVNSVKLRVDRLRNQLTSGSIPLTEGIQALDSALDAFMRDIDASEK